MNQLDEEDLACDLASPEALSLVVRYPGETVAVLHCIPVPGSLPGRSVMQLRIIAVQADISDAAQVSSTNKSVSLLAPLSYLPNPST